MSGALHGQVNMLTCTWRWSRRTRKQETSCVIAGVFSPGLSSFEQPFFFFQQRIILCKVNLEKRASITPKPLAWTRRRCVFVHRYEGFKKTALVYNSALRGNHAGFQEPWQDFVF